MNKTISAACFLVCILALGIWAFISISGAIRFSLNCGAYLERAANANSIELAEENLNKAIEYLDNNNLTQGQVTIFFKNPKNDIGYWYINLKSAQEQLRTAPDNMSELEKSNVLMKLRETLTDSSDSGTKLVKPDGISVYPYNAVLFWMCTISMIAIAPCYIWAAIENDWLI